MENQIYRGYFVPIHVLNSDVTPRAKEVFVRLANGEQEAEVMLRMGEIRDELRELRDAKLWLSKPSKKEVNTLKADFMKAYHHWCKEIGHDPEEFNGQDRAGVSKIVMRIQSNLKLKEADRKQFGQVLIELFDLYRHGGLSEFVRAQMLRPGKMQGVIDQLLQTRKMRSETNFEENTQAKAWLSRYAK